MIWRIMHELPWITIFCHEWGNSAMIVTSDEVTSENHCRIASRVTKQSLFTVKNVLFYFLHAILCHEDTNPLSSSAHFVIVAKGGLSDRALWRHHNWSVTSANAKYWYCDVTFVYCHCTRKLTQRRSSLVNNSNEYRYLATRYSWLSV